MKTDKDIAQEFELFSACLDHSEDEWENVLTSRCDSTELRERVLRLLQRHRNTHSEEAGFLKLTGSDPETIGPYRVLRRLDEGGMGIVYSAEQREPVHRRVAIKVLRGGYNNREILARFEIERQSLALMNHANIARIYDAGATEDQRPYIVMEFVPGEAITRYCEQRNLPLDMRLQLFCDVCDAIQHAHQRGVIHRDLKPSNILIMEQDGKPIPKVIDFGIAKAVSGRLTDRTLETKIGSLLGTPDYMSPEQAELSPLDVDTRSDVYALGAVLYQLLTGVPPLQLSGSGKSYPEMQRVIHEQQPVPPSQRVGGPLQRQMRGELDWITMKALEKQRSQRYASPADFAADIRRHLADETVLAGPPSRLRKIDKFVRRHWLVTASATVVIATIAASQVLLIQKNRELEAERERTAVEADASRRVTNFLVDVFRGADPVSQGGRTLTAREVLDSGVQQLDERFPEASITRVALFQAVGNAYLNLGAYDVAEHLLRRAYDDAVQVHGPDHEETFRIERSIGRTLVYSGHFTEAVEHFRKHAAHAEAAFGPEHKWTLRARAALGPALEHAGKPEESAEILRDVLPRMRVIFGPDDPDTIYALANYGSVLDTLNRFEEALPILKEAAAAVERLHGPDHPYTIGVRYNVADTLTSLGDFDQAEPLHRDVLARHQRVLGPTHARTFASMRALAELLSAQGKQEEAFALMKTAHERMQAVPGTSEFIKLETQVGYARLVRIAENLDDADELLRDAIVKLTPLVGEQHPLLARAWRERALVAMTREDHEAALTALAAASKAGLDRTELQREEFVPLAEDPRFIALTNPGEEKK